MSELIYVDFCSRSRGMKKNNDNHISTSNSSLTSEDYFFNIAQRLAKKIIINGLIYDELIKSKFVKMKPFMCAG